VILTLVIITVVAMFAGAFFWLGVSIERERKRQLQSLAESKCLACGNHYGMELAMRSRGDYLKECCETRTNRPNCKIEFVNYWKVRCAQCGDMAQFHYETKKLVHPVT